MSDDRPDPEKDPRDAPIADLRIDWDLLTSEEAEELLALMRKAQAD